MLRALACLALGFVTGALVGAHARMLIDTERMDRPSIEHEYRSNGTRETY